MNQLQARALGDPTRHRIFEYVADAGAPVDVGEITDHFGLNHNAIRQHLAKLVEAGLVIQTLAPVKGRGRPRQMFEVDSAVDRAGDGPYRRLNLLLVEMLRTGDDPVEVGRRTGQWLIAQRGQGTDAVEGLEHALRRGGFDPILVGESETPEFVLRHCPFADTAAADPDTICAIHLGLTQGLADGYEGVVVDALEPRDPHRAGCRLRFHRDEV